MVYRTASHTQVYSDKGLLYQPGGEGIDLENHTKIPEKELYIHNQFFQENVMFAQTITNNPELLLQRLEELLKK